MAKVQSLRRLTSADRPGAPVEKGKPDRVSTKCVAAHLPEDVYWQLKELAVKQRVEMQTIMAQAANALFEKNGMPVFPVISLGANGKRQPITYES